MITSANLSVIDTGTVLHTDPIITRNGETGEGRIYRDPAQDGPRTMWLFGGTTSAFDVASGFEGGPDTTNFLNQMATFKFTDLFLLQSPVIDTSNGGVTNLGLVGVNGLTTGGPNNAPFVNGFLLDFTGISSLLLATESGSINLGAGYLIRGMDRLFVYARGGNLTINSDINASAAVHLYSTGTASLGGRINTAAFSSFSGGDFLFGSGLVTAGSIDITSQNNVNFNAAQFSLGANGSVFLDAMGVLNINPTGGDQTIFSQVNSFDAFGDTINIFLPGGVNPPFTITFNPAAALTRFTAGLGGIQASDIAFLATNLQLFADGDINIYGVDIPFVNNGRTIAGTISAGGAFNAIGDVTTATLTAGSSVSVGGNLFVVDVTAGTTIDVGGTLSGFGTATAGGNITAFSTAIPTIFSPTGMLIVGGGGIHPFVEEPNGASLQHTITVSTIVSPAGIDFSGNQFNGAGGFFSGGRLTLNVDSIRFDAANGVGPAIFDGADGFGNGRNPPNSGGGDGGVFTVNSTGDIFVGEFISATTGLNDPNGPLFSGAGGQVTLDSSSGNVTVNATIQVSSDDRIQVAAPGGSPPPARAQSASGGDITIHSGLTSGTAITLTNTSHLLSYLNAQAPGPGGTISVTSDGGDIIANGEIIADRGTIIISNGGPGGRPNVVGFPNPLISLTGSAVRLRAETLDITSAGDIQLGLSGEFLDLGSVTVSISAVNDITGGFVYSGGGKGPPVTASASDGNFSFTAQGAITLDGLTAGRANSGRTNGINLTVEAGTSLSLGSLDLNTVTDGLIAGGDITVRSGTDAQINFVSLQTDASANTGSGGSILFQSGGNLNAGSFSSRATVGAPLGSGANVTLNVGSNAVFDDGNGGGDLNLLVDVFNAGTLNTGGNIMSTVGGGLTAYSLSAVVDGYDQITNGGNINLTIAGDLTVGPGGALFQILAQNPGARNGSGAGPTLNVSAANITVGEADVGGNLIAYIDDSGSGIPSGQTAVSVLIQSAGTINLPFGVLNVLGTVSAGGDINVYTLASTNVISTTSIHADFGGIRRFTAFGPLGTPPIDFLHTLTAPIVSSFGGIDFNGRNAFNGDPGFGSTDGGALTINANLLTFGSGPGSTIAGSVTLNGGDGDGPLLGGNGGTLTVNTTGDILVGNDIEATTGGNGQTDPPTGNGGTVNLNSTSGTVTVNSRIEVSSADAPTPTPAPPRRRSNRGGNISITSGKVAPVGSRAVAVNIGDSSQLLALLDAAATGPGGRITILATGANSDVNVGGRIQADRGTIDIRHQGDGGHVNIGAGPNAGAPSMMSADVIKAGAFGANGQLNVGGSILNADTLIRLYATGSNGELNFIANTTLSSGRSIDLAANTVTIQPRVIVTIAGNAGPANVYTNNPNYSGFGGNNPSNGTFGGNGANNPQPLANAPGFDSPPPPVAPAHGGL